MKTKFFFSLTCCLLLQHGVYAQMQIPGYGLKNVIGGYERDVAGEVIPYFSAYPQFAKDALLTRCTDGNKEISWQSAVVPANNSDEYLYFYFLAGHSTGTSKADRHFDLYINGKKYVTFTTPQRKKPPFTWSFTGADSVQLIFSATFTDLYDDAHGKLFLKLPRKLTEQGKPVVFSIKGHGENSYDWFMLHRYSYTEKVVVEPTSLLKKEAGVSKQIVRIMVDHTFSTADTLRLKMSSGVHRFLLQPGYNYFELALQPVSKAADESMAIDIAGKFQNSVSIRFYPVNKREVDLIHHSHNDIGYSHIQEDVVKIQDKNIRDALMMIERTKNNPAGSRFKWNIESVWAVDNFLNESSEAEKEMLFDAIRNDDICLSGHYANILTGLCKPEELGWITERAVQLRKQYNLPVNSVMLTDIPGVSWSQVQALADNGFKYFSNGPNYQPKFADKGDRIGATLHELGDKPFYWLGEDGKSKILFWTAGRGYSMFHQIPFDELEEKRKDKISDYMMELDSTSYPYEMVQLRYNIKSDNGPVDEKLCDFVKKWNEEYESPKLVMTTVNAMMQKFEKMYGDKLPVMNGDFTPYWEDGAYSTAREESDVRLTSEKLIQLQKFYSLNAAAPIDTGLFYLARRSIIMFQEHTWGSWNSISEPDIEFTTHQWNYKKRFCDSAVYYVQQIENALLPGKKNYSRLEVWNTLGWERDGYVEVSPPQNVDFLLTDLKGAFVPFQKLRNGNICFVAKNIPANGSRIYMIVAKKKFNADFQKPVTALGMDMDIDVATGAVKSFRAGNTDLVDTALFKGLQSALYVAGLNPEDFAVSQLQKTETVNSGNVVRSLKVTCSLKGTNSVTYFISQFSGLEYLHLTTIIDKKEIREKESVHIAFPFNIKDVSTRFGMKDTFVTYEQGQLAAANKDFFSVQRWLDVSGKDRGVTIVSPQCSLWETGGMTDERSDNNAQKVWKRKNSSSSLLFAYVMNNYWNTNFKAGQDGIARFDFYLKPHEGFSGMDARHFGYEVNQPLLVLYK